MVAEPCLIGIFEIESKSTVELKLKLSTNTRLFIRIIQGSAQPKEIIKNPTDLKKVTHNLPPVKSETVFPF